MSIQLVTNATATDTEGNAPKGIWIKGSNAPTWKGAQHLPVPTWFDGHLVVEGDGWAIFGKPTLRQLLRYWWHNR